MNNPITKGLAKQLLELTKGTFYNYSAFNGSARKLIDGLIQDGFLVKPKQVRCNNSVSLLLHLKNHYGIEDLQKYIDFLDKPINETTRAEAMEVTGNDKIRKTTVLSGFLVYSYTDLNCLLKEKPVNTNSINGSFIFIDDYSKFSIPESVTVVIVENYENFKAIEKQKDLFGNITPLFVWRYSNSKAIVKWLAINNNDFMYFGDFDFASPVIYISEFKNKLPKNKSSFFTPTDLDTFFLNHSDNSGLYDKQYNRYKNFDYYKYTELDTLINSIKKYKKGIVQEVLLNLKP